jgi:hypothetical protein
VKTKKPVTKSKPLNVKSGLKAGRLAVNHSKPGLKVKSGVKGGRLAGNHARVVL